MGLNPKGAHFYGYSNNAGRSRAWSPYLRKFASKENANAYARVWVVPYNITSKCQIDAVVPYLSILPDAAPSQSGFGDMKFFTKYQIYQKNGKGKTA